MSEAVNLKTLNSSFRFLGTAKTKLFSEYMKEANGFFAENTTLEKSIGIPYFHAGAELVFEKQTTFRSDKLPCFFIIYIAKGQGRLFFNNESFSISEKSFFVLKPNCTFEFHTDGNFLRMIFFFVNAEEISFYLKHVHSPQNEFLYIEKFCTSSMQSLFEQLIHILKYPVPHSNMFLAKYLRDIFCEIVYSQIDKKLLNLPDHIRTCKQLMDEKYMNPITLYSLEKLLKINRYRLCHEFSAYIGKSPMQYLLAVRIEKSKELLSNTDMTVHAIGEQVGIPNATHFINQFRKLNEITPLQFRKSVFGKL